MYTYVMSQSAAFTNFINCTDTRQYQSNKQWRRSTEARGKIHIATYNVNKPHVCACITTPEYWYIIIAHHMQVFVQSLSPEQLQRAVCRLAGARGGISLLQTLVQDSPPGPERPPGEDIPEWCKCGRCRPMDTPAENVCCKDVRCITTFDHFHLLCLNHPVLTIAIHQRYDIRADAVSYSPA